MTFSFSAMRKNSRKRILYFYLHSLDGKPRYDPFEYRFLESLCRKYEVIVAFFTRSKHYIADPRVVPKDAQALHVRDLWLPANTPIMVRWAFETVARTLKVALLRRSLRPDLVYGNWITRSSGLYCAMTRCHPFLVAAWGSDILVEARQSRILRMLGKLTVRAADAVIVDSEVQRRAVLDLGCASSKICSFPWGIDLERFDAGKRETVRQELNLTRGGVVISTRKHFPVYGVEYLIRAIPLVVEKMRDVKFLIIGDGPLLEYYKALASELKVESHVEFLGYVRNDLLPRLLHAADVYVSTSLSDGSSASLMEALACGLPVVATRIPANEEWINEGKNGFLTPLRDSRTLADHIILVLQDHKLRSRMSKFNVRLARKRANWKRNSLVLEKCVSRLLISAS